MIPKGYLLLLAKETYIVLEPYTLFSTVEDKTDRKKGQLKNKRRIIKLCKQREKSKTERKGENKCHIRDKI